MEENPALNQTAGLNLCLIEGNWDEGLPKLAAGSDEQLVRVARDDLAGPTDAAQRAALADRWWDMSNSEQYAAPGSDAQKQLRERAAKWWALARDDLEGDEKLRVDGMLFRAKSGDGPDPALLPDLKGLECRDAKWRPFFLAAFGGNAESEAAVEGALTWLSQHQQDNGSWNFRHTGPPCNSKCPNPGSLDDAPNVATALALLPFFGADHGPYEGPYHECVAKGLRFLQLQLGKNGSLYDTDAGSFPSQALATLALCEGAQFSTSRPNWDAARAALKIVLSTQNSDGGWSATKPNPGKKPPASSIESTYWNAAALATAGQLGLPIPQAALDRARRYLEEAQQGLPASRTTEEAAATLGRIILGEPRDHQLLADYAVRVAAEGPSTDGNLYRNYLQSQLLRDHGGRPWEAYNATLRDALLAAQATDGHTAGSWYFSDNGPTTKYGGRLLNTALGALLEVYYRNPMPRQ